MRNSTRVALLACTVIACGGGVEDADGDAPPAPPAGPPLTEHTLPIAPDTRARAVLADSLPPRDAAVRDTISVEGRPQPLDARLVRAPRAFDLPFTTYTPTDMRVETTAEGDSTGIRFTAEFGGTYEPNAYMHVAAYRAGTTQAVARDIIGGFLLGRVPTDDPITAGRAGWQPVDAPAWAEEAYSFRYAGARTRYVGNAVLARRGARFFHVITHYPAEYGDGIGPRFAYILRQWRWEDTGQRLMDEPEM